MFAQNIVELGGNAVLCDINEQVLKCGVEKLNAKRPGSAIAVVCDVRDYNQVVAARDKAVETFGRIDILANFAGGAASRILKVDHEKCPEFPDVPIDVWEWGIDVNLKGAFYFNHAVAKTMRDQ